MQSKLNHIQEKLTKNGIVPELTLPTIQKLSNRVETGGALQGRLENDRMTKGDLRITGTSTVIKSK